MSVLLDGFTVLIGDLEITDLSQPHGRSKIQVYKRNHHKIANNGAVVVGEYNKIHYNYNEAIEDFLELKKKFYA